ncbi:MAG: hypothetical protein K2W95_06110 [Candidatus Obscuribacterales bacterium]|nr:hypothetical protein [Candidatus Obscuribacterales bacterium]
MSDYRLKPLGARPENRETAGNSVGDDAAAQARKLYLEVLEKQNQGQSGQKPSNDSPVNSTVPNLSDHERQLQKLGVLLLENFNALDTDGNKYLSPGELERASQSDRWKDSERSLFRSAAKNAELLSSMVRERINMVGQTIEGAGVSREDLHCVQSAFNSAHPFDIYANRRINALFPGGIAGCFVGIGLGARAGQQVEKWVANCGPRVRGLAPIATFVGVTVGGIGAGVAAGDALYEANVGTSEFYYAGKRNELSKFKW